MMFICKKKLLQYPFVYRPNEAEEQKTRDYNDNYTKDAVTTYHISKAAIEDASQETALLALLPNCRINAKRRARRCLNMNSILLLAIFYFLVAVPSTYQQCKCKVQFYIKTILKIVRRNHKI